VIFLLLEYQGLQLFSFNLILSYGLKTYFENKELQIKPCLNVPQELLKIKDLNRFLKELLDFFVIIHLLDSEMFQATS